MKNKTLLAKIATKGDLLNRGEAVSNPIPKVPKAN
jgi:hypothetical protein